MADTDVPDDRRIKVLYIAGYGRSGSTLLDILLSQQESIFGAGEISALTRHVWSNNELCACGKAAKQCAVWSQVLDSWVRRSHADPDTDVDTYRVEQHRAETLLSPSRILRDASFVRYRRETTALLASIAERTSCSVIVDSSKLPGRGLALAAMREVDLTVLHLVRDGRGVAWSLAKPFKRDVARGLQKEIRRKSWLRTAIRWSVVNLMTELLCWRVGRSRSIRIRYEDMVHDPARIASTIHALLHGKLAQPLDPDLAPRHQIAGNRLRMQRSIRLKPDERWRSEMPTPAQLAFSLLCAPLLLRYGYPFLNRRAPHRSIVTASSDVEVRDA
ncbi:sulfotransferase [Sphingomonas arenae]|uniref:sulfotransferase n=1 Tax=Sphingomonas arenae TaxID=2812555 RepID=UPI001967BF79|nr:sulfotransferase [Sphingomonas arenae]